MHWYSHPGIATRKTQDGDVVYFKPNDNWLLEDAWFSVYIKATDSWIKDELATEDDLHGQNIYKVNISGRYTDLIFVRHNPAFSEMSGESKWNMSRSLSIETGKELFVINEPSWDYGGGDWMTIDEYLNPSFASISGIEISEDAPVEYYNLQGFRVENPHNGLFIRRQGNKVGKIFLNN